MLRLFSSMGILNQIMLILAATTAIVIGVSAVRYVCFVDTRSCLVVLIDHKLQIFLSDSKDEFNYEDDDAIYAFYGASRKRGAGSKRSVIKIRGPGG